MTRFPPPPPLCSIRVSLKKPMGLVLEQNRKTMDIYVVEVLPEGSAAREGRIAAGDQLIATSAIVYSAEEDYGGVAVKKGEQKVRLMVKGESFDTGAGAGCSCRMCAAVWRAARLLSRPAAAGADAGARLARHSAAARGAARRRQGADAASVVRGPCAVMRAIGTHPGHVPVTLDIQKCKTLKQLAAEGGRA